jgi:Cysteine-rich CPCC
LARVACPCCQLPTLTERGVYDICPVCWWEDDGQEDADADLVRGGPNRRYSLTQARANTRDHGDMYDPGQGIAVVLRPTEERLRLLDLARQMWSGALPVDEAALQRRIDAQRASQA